MQRSGNARALRGLTFDMSGGAKGAKRPLERPLDGGVRPHAVPRLASARGKRARVIASLSVFLVLHGTFDRP